MRHAIRTILASMILLAAAGAAPASEDLRNSIAILAEKVLSVLKDEPKAVKVGRFAAKRCRRRVGFHRGPLHGPCRGEVRVC